MKKKRKKRTISSEHLAKLQEGRRKSRLHKKRIKRLSEHGMTDSVPLGYTERLLSGLRRED